ncbi:MAG: hypothetical protein V3S29_04020 [bacterium]
MKRILAFVWVGWALAGFWPGGNVLLAQEAERSEGDAGGSFSLVIHLPGYSNTPQGTTIDLVPVLFLFPLTERQELWVAPYANQITPPGGVAEPGSYGVSVSVVHHFSRIVPGKRPVGPFLRAQASPGIRPRTGESGAALSVGGGWHEGQQWFFVFGWSFGATYVQATDSGTGGWSNSRWKFDLGLGYRVF